MRVALAVIVFALGCKGSTGGGDVAAPSSTTSAASDPPSALAAASAPPVVASTAPSTPPSASAPPTSTFGSLRHAPPGPCSCARVQVGGIYPHQNGHAIHRNGIDQKVLSVDGATCTATVKDVNSGATRTEPCNGELFDEPRINPAG